MRESRRQAGALVVLLALAGTMLGAHASALPPEAPGRALILTLDPEHADPLGVPGAIRLHHLPFAILRGPAPTALDVTRAPGVLRVDAAEPLELHLDRVHALMRGPRAPSGPLLPATGAGVGLAIVDSGIDAAHPDLSGRVRANLRLAGDTFLPSPADATGHGTHVAGIASGSGVASDGRHVGLAPDAHLVGLDITGAFDTAAALQAFDWILAHHDEHDLRVVVNAWGRKGPARVYDATDPIHVATDHLVDAGLVVLYSSGNRGPGPATLTPEAQHPRALTVGAVDDAAGIASYSGRGPVLAAGGTPWVKPDVVAPGDHVAAPRAATAPEAAEPGAAYRELSGTSQAVPAVAGVVALLLEAHPHLPPDEVARVLRESAHDLGEEGPDAAHGWGLVDARRALDVAAGRAPDTTHLLEAGGIDRHHQEGELLAARDRGLHLTDTAAAGPVAFKGRIPVLPGATRLDVTLRWTGDADYALTLNDGHTRHSATEARAGPDGRRVIHLTVPDPVPGVWKADAEGDAMGHVQYALDAHVTVDPTSHATDAGTPPGSPQEDPVHRIANLLPARSTQLAFEAGLLLALAVTATARRNA